MDDIKIENLVNIYKERNELDFLFNICKIVALSDSIGDGYGYCYEYTHEMFNNAEKYSQYGGVRYDQYLYYCGIKIYEEYLKQIKAI